MVIPRRFLLLIDLFVVFAIISSSLYVLGFNPLPALASHASELRVWLAGHGGSITISAGTEGVVLSPHLDPIPVPDPQTPSAAADCNDGSNPLACLFPEGKYADSLLPIPYNATLAPRTTQRCGGWHRATSSDTCASMRGDQSLALLLAANPSLVVARGQDHAECDDAKIEPGLLYCLLPLRSWTSPPSGDNYLPGVRDWGCWANSDPGGLVLGTGNLTQTKAYDEEAMTPAACARHCFGRAGVFGGDFGAVANGTTCYCGTALNVNSRQVELDRCRVPCAGDKAQMCGGTEAFSLFGSSWRHEVPRQWERNGCYHSPGDSHALAHAAPDHPHGNFMDEFLCRRLCFPQYLLYGLAEGSECRCGDEISPSASRVDDTKCDALCPAPRASYCGGKGGHMEIWGATVDRTESFASSGQRVDLAPSRVTFNFSLPFHYYDCSFDMVLPFKEGQDVTAVRGDLTSGPSLLDRADMSPRTCADYCISQQGRDGFALARGRDCYCFDNQHAHRYPAGSSRCNATCSGSPTESCGGDGEGGPPPSVPGSPPLSVYGVRPDPKWLAISAGDVGSPPAGDETHRARYVDHLGCMSEGVINERFVTTSYYVSQGGDDEAPPTIMDATGMTLPTCATFCVARGFRYFSLTGGTECRCGTRLAHGAVARFENACDVACSGNATQVCGGELSHSIFGYYGL